ncbi:MAG: ammonium transporter [Planctomycetaceae bacterium]|nr:ammonium transporter [Planctomycetaceae bacterium]
MKLKTRLAVGVCALGMFLAQGGTIGAQEEAAGEATTDAAALWTTEVAVDTLWVLAAGFLVFFMNAGFGCVEAGFCRAKNAVNILGKNFVVFGISSLAFWILGWAIMFGDGNDWLGSTGWLVAGADNSPAVDNYEGVYGSISWSGIPLFAKFFFQLVFAGTAATIVSGCVAERIHYKSYMLFTVFLVALSYPITGHWIWGGGWLAKLGMWDFAGSTVVHSVGGWAGLAGILLLGPRIGKYREGKPQAIPGHNMALAFLGGMILWLGWFGFNPGSTMGISGEGAKLVAHIVVTTNLACAAGLIVATLLSWSVLGKPDFSMTVNGALAGLVAITAPCAFVSATSAVIIGAVGGMLVVFSVLTFDRWQIDDPVGALSVHLTNGIWGTLAVGLFAQQAIGGGIDKDGLFCGGDASLLFSQIKGVLAVGAFTFIGSLIIWSIIKAIVGLRVEAVDETKGLDVSEMGMEAYAADTVV